MFEKAQSQKEKEKGLIGVRNIWVWGKGACPKSSKHFKFIFKKLFLSTLNQSKCFKISWSKIIYNGHASQLAVGCKSDVYLMQTCVCRRSFHTCGSELPSCHRMAKNHHGCGSPAPIKYQPLLINFTHDSNLWPSTIWPHPSN